MESGPFAERYLTPPPPFRQPTPEKGAAPAFVTGDASPVRSEEQPAGSDVADIPGEGNGHHVSVPVPVRTEAAHAAPEPAPEPIRSRAAVVAEDDEEAEVPEVGPGYDPATAVQRWTPRANTSSKVTTDTREAICVEEVVQPRTVPAEMGWRHALYVATGHLVNLGAGPKERCWLDWVSAISGNIPGRYQIAAVCVKGGVGKTRIVAGVGTAMKLFRTEPIIAVDANPTYSRLGQYIDPKASQGVREFLSDPRVGDYTIARQYTGQNVQGLEVLAGNQNTSNPLALDTQVFADILSRTRKNYDLALIDCGDVIEHPVMAGVLSAADSLMIVTSCDIDGGLAAEQTINWLDARNGHELLKRSVLVLNDAHRCKTKKFTDEITQKLGPQVGAVEEIPFDIHLRDGAVFDWEALRKDTQWALVKLAAKLAGGFPTAGALAR